MKGSEDHSMESMSEAKEGVTCQMEPESVGLVFHHLTWEAEQTQGVPNCLVCGHTGREQAWRMGTIGDIQSKLI